MRSAAVLLNSTMPPFERANFMNLTHTINTRFEQMTSLLCDHPDSTFSLARITESQLRKNIVVSPPTDQEIRRLRFNNIREANLAASLALRSASSAAKGVKVPAHPANEGWKF